MILGEYVSFWGIIQVKLKRYWMLLLYIWLLAWSQTDEVPRWPSSGGPVGLWGGSRRSPAESGKMNEKDRPQVFYIFCNKKFKGKILLRCGILGNLSEWWSVSFGQLTSTPGPNTPVRMRTFVSFPISLHPHLYSLTIDKVHSHASSSVRLYWGTAGS